MLRAARTFAESIGDATEINCPACGQAVTADGFSEHVKTETERLQEAEDAFDTYKSVVGSVCNCLEALKSNLRKPDLKDWTDGFSDQALRNGLQYLGQVNPDALRENCSVDDLNTIENMLLPIIAAAARDSTGAPPDVQMLTGDKNRLGVAESVISSRNPHCLNKTVTQRKWLPQIKCCPESGRPSRGRRHQQDGKTVIAGDDCERRPGRRGSRSSLRRFGDSTALDQSRRATGSSDRSGGTVGQAVKQPSTARRILHAQEKSVLLGREQSRGSPVDTTWIWEGEGQVVATRRFCRSR